MKYLQQNIVLRQHIFDLQEKMQILLQIKNKAFARDIVAIDGELNSVQDEIIFTNAAINILEAA